MDTSDLKTITEGNRLASQKQRLGRAGRKPALDDVSLSLRPLKFDAQPDTVDVTLGNSMIVEVKVLAAHGCTLTWRY